jgi:hypothetical protein
MDREKPSQIRITNRQVILTARRNLRLCISPLATSQSLNDLPKKEKGLIDRARFRNVVCAVLDTLVPSKINEY